MPRMRVGSRSCWNVAYCGGVLFRRGRFVELRDLTRYRKRMVEVRTQEVVRLHGVLQRAGIKLSSVAKDIMGVSGRAILQALVEGKKDAAAMAELAKGSLRGKIPLLRKALEGQFAGHHRIMVTQMLAHVHYLEENDRGTQSGNRSSHGALSTSTGIIGDHPRFRKTERGSGDRRNRGRHESVSDGGKSGKLGGSVPRQSSQRRKAQTG